MLTVDFHAHSTASVHAMPTLEELLRQASNLGMAGLLVSDHSPGTDNSVWLARHDAVNIDGEARIGGADHHYFKVFLSRYEASPEHSTQLFKGIETNILGEGERGCDVPLSLAPDFDVVIASVHLLPHLFQVENMDKTTDRMILAMDEPIDVIGHPFHEISKPGMKTLVREAAAKGIALELNNASLRHGKAKASSAREMLNWAKKEGCRISLGSDTHVLSELGRDEHILPLLVETGFPEELIVNRSLQAARSFIAERKAIRAVA